MDRNYFYTVMGGDGRLDYEKYIDAQALLSCQKDFSEFCNEDELQFQVVHQITELWMKVIAYTLLELDERLESGETNRGLTLFRRIHLIQEVMIDLLKLLDTMSPKAYQEIRVRLGQGSVRESPNYRAMVRMHQPVWRTFKTRYLDEAGATLKEIYDSGFACCDAYLIAESFVKYDELFQRWRFHHVQMVHRTIGPSATSLRGNPVEGLNDGLRSKLFPELWEIRSRMTDDWNERHGAVRPNLDPPAASGVCPYAAEQAMVG